MGLETVGIGLAIGSLLVSGISSFVGMAQAGAQADAAAAAAEANFEREQEELTRQQRETNRIAREEKSDVIRKADQQLGTIRAAAGEAGASATSMVRMLVELGGAEGTDLSRIERNRENRVEALQSSKKASAQGYTNTVTRAYNEAQSRQIDSILGFVGSGLQIGSSYYAAQQQLELARNTQTARGD